MNVPTIEMPEALRVAADRLDEREQQLRDAEAAVVAAREGLARAHQRDVDEVATAREAGGPDPPARHEVAAQKTLAAAERDLEIMQARAAKLRREYDQLAEEQRTKWRAALEREWSKIDKAQRRRTQELEAGFARQRDLRATWQYIDAVEHGENAEWVLNKALSPGGSPAADLHDVLAALEAGSAEVVIERVTHERQEREDREEAARRAHEEAVEEARRAFEDQRLHARRR